MKIKHTLVLGTGALFVLIVIVSSVGIGAIYLVKQHTAAIVQANHASITYMHRMLKNIEKGDAQSLKKFESDLHKQMGNITEEGESVATKKLWNDYKHYTINPQKGYAHIKDDIYTIITLNMQAIERKSIEAQQQADTATFWIMVTSSCCVLLALTLVVNIPAAITHPIQKIMLAISQFSQNNYSNKIVHTSHDEFRPMVDAFNTMAETLEEYTHSMLSDMLMEKKRIASLIDNFYDPIIGFDHSMNGIFVNKEFLKIAGLTVDDIVGVSAYTTAERNNLLSTLLQDIAQSSSENNQSINRTLTISYDKKELYFEKEIIPLSLIPSGESSPVHGGYVCILRNITAYRELDIAKTHLIATLSHEFKTPIASIRMSLQLLHNEKTGTISPKQRELLESIDEDTRRLLTLVGEVLTMAQVESGNIHLSLYPSSVQDIIDYALTAIMAQARQKNIECVVKYPAVLLPQVMVDSEKTAWVLVNLLSNALRYSHEGSTVTIDVQYNNHNISIAVTDKGRGIAQEYVPKLFDRYFRVPGTSREGNGLGLSISKEFIEAQGGTMTVQSEIGVGTTFTVYLCVA